MTGRAAAVSTKGKEARNTVLVPMMHTIQHHMTVEVWTRPPEDGGELLGVLHPAPGGFRFVSRYLSKETDVSLTDGEAPALHVRLQGVPEP